MLPTPTAVTTQPRTKTKLTNADYMRLTPPVPDGPRYQLIDGELIAMSGAILAHQIFLMQLSIPMVTQANAMGMGEVIPAPYDVHIDEFNTYQPDLIFVSNARRAILQRLGAFGAPDVVVEILSDSTRRRDLREKLPVYLRAGVLEVVIVDLADRTVAVYAGGDAAAPARVFAAADTLTLGAMPGVAVPLAPLFARALAAA